MQIRAINKKDQELFFNMVDGFYHSTAVLHSIPEENIYRTFEEICNNSPYVKGYLFEEDGIPAGYGQVSLTYSNEAGGLCVWVEEVLILEEFRGHGLGHQFFSFLEKEFSHAKRFRLEVTRENERAASLYRKLGYEDFDYLQMVKEC